MDFSSPNIPRESQLAALLVRLEYLTLHATREEMTVREPAKLTKGVHMVDGMRAGVVRVDRLLQCLQERAVTRKSAYIKLCNHSDPERLIVGIFIDLFRASQ